MGNNARQSGIVPWPRPILGYRGSLGASLNQGHDRLRYHAARLFRGGAIPEAIAALIKVGTDTRLVYSACPSSGHNVHNSHACSR